MRFHYHLLFKTFKNLSYDKKILFFILLVFTNNAYAQPPAIIDGIPLDSCIITFDINDSLTRNVFHNHITVDTTGTALWSIGGTTKPFFSSGSSIRGLMTDTANSYPVNANEWFILKLESFMNMNPIISFTHKWETTAGHDGGIVEFSSDSGLTWHNVMDSCNVTKNTSQWRAFGVHTDNFPLLTDTLLNGEVAFNGVNNTWQYSRLQFFNFIAIKTTGTWQDECVPHDTIFVRFRFKSDDTLENLDGWIIDDIKVEYDQYGGGVSNINENKFLKVSPNPSVNGIFQFPQLDGEKKYKVDIVNALGVKVLSVPYTRSIDLSTQPKGMYFYKVSDQDHIYTGKLLIE